MLGRTVSHYRIVSQLGAGGMGVVYRAEDVRLARPVAVKFVQEELTHDRHALERFQFEARAASALNHPNICTIYDIGEDESGHPFIVMELMKGQTLRDRLASGPLKTHQIVDVGIQVADALDAAHGRGIVHRDIKPANIFLVDRGPVKVLDFGLAKLSVRHAGLDEASTTTAAEPLSLPAVTMGTVAYMSPEQVTGDELDARTDLFSLGVVLYECSTGQRPFTGNTSGVVLAAILNRAPVSPVVLKPGLPLRLQEILNNCLEKDRELRYQTAADLRADLKRARRDLESGHSGALYQVAGSRADTRGPVAEGEGVAPAVGEFPPVPVPAAGRTAATHRRRWLIGASVLAVALAAGGTYWLTVRPDAPAATITDPAIASDDRRAARQAPAEAPPAVPVPVPSAGSAAPAVAPPRQTVLAPRSRSGRASAPSPPSVASSPDRRDPIPSEALPEVAALPPVSAPSSPPVIQPPQAQPPQTQAPPQSQSQPQPAQATAPESAPASREARQSQDAPSAPTSQAAQDEAAIRRVVTAYARAIETKDLSLFRSVKPNLSREEQRRLEESFRAVNTQQVRLTWLAMDRRGSEATVRVRRRDILEAGGRTQTIDTEQLLTLERAANGWVIVAIGR